jgi:phospholipid/cholesterol/gamma-HCH transport system permease protein
VSLSDGMRDTGQRGAGARLAALGAATVRAGRAALELSAFAASVLATAAARDTWRRPVRAAFRHTLHRLAVRGLGTLVVTGAVLGLTLVAQLLYWLDITGQGELAGTLMTGLILFGRMGMAVLIDLGEARPRGWLRELERRGLDPLALMVVPRVLGFAAAALCVATVLLASTLFFGYLGASALGLVAYSIWDFADIVLRAMDASDFIVPPLKCLLIGFFVALICCATGLARDDAEDELQRLLSRGFVRAALAILVVNGLFDLVSWHGLLG